jgi:transposase
LFVGSKTGGQTAAVLFSFTSTCRRLNLDPFAYLRDVLNCLAADTLRAADLALLLPHRWTPPAA